jgi:hypothetical protein
VALVAGLVTGAVVLLVSLDGTVVFVSVVPSYHEHTVLRLHIAAS